MENWHGLGVLRGLSAVALVAVVGCGAPHMARPRSFSDGMDKLTTEGRSGPSADGAEEAFKLGPYTIDSVKRNVSSSEGFDMFEGFEPAKKGGYRFRLAGGGKKTLAGKCATLAAKKTKQLDGSITTEEEPYLACTCELAGDSVAYVFVEDLAGEFGGPLIVRGAEAQVTGVYELDSGDKLKGRPAGYRIDDRDGALAAAGVLPGEAHVWIKSRLEEPDRRRMVCILAGLMLWFPPDEGKD